MTGNRTLFPLFFMTAVATARFFCRTTGSGPDSETSPGSAPLSGNRRQRRAGKKRKKAASDATDTTAEVRTDSFATDATDTPTDATDTRADATDTRADATDTPADATDIPADRSFYDFVGRVIACTNPAFDREGRCFFEVTLEHLQGGGPVNTTPFYDLDLYQAASFAMSRGLHVHAFGALVLPEYDGRPRTALFELDELRDVRSRTELLGVTPEMIDEADRFIELHSQTPGALEAELIKLGYCLFNAVYSSRSNRLQQCERATLLQSLSAGQVGPTVNPRISMAIVSRPAAGKKMMSNLALLFAPLGQVIQPSTVSMAGLGAAVRCTKKGFVAQPGKLPQCHGGVAVIEDLHRIPSKVLRDLQGLILGVAEDGITIQTKAASAEYVAQVALHLNMNTQSVVHARLRAPGMAAKIKDLGIPVDMLTRIDLLIELTLGDNATKQAEDMVAQDIPEATDEHAAEQVTRSLLVKTVVARLVDRHRKVRFQGCEDKLRELMRDISVILGHFSAKMTDEQQQYFDVDGLLRRIANSVRKLVSASARLNNRGHITEDDIAVAWEMLSYKLEFVRWLCDDAAVRVRTLVSREQIVAEARSASNARWIEMLTRYGGQRMAISEVAAQMGLPVRTVGRDLEGQGYFPEWGVCQFPTLVEEAERRQRQEAPPEPPPDYNEDHHNLPDGQTVQEAQAPPPEDQPPRVLLDPPTADTHRVVMAFRTPQLCIEQEQLIYYLLGAAFDFDSSKYGTWTKVDVLRLKVLEVLADTKENVRIVNQMRTQLKSEDQMQRIWLALQIIAFSGWRVPTYPYRRLLLRDDVPEAAKAAIESMLVREQWELDQVGVHARRAEEAAQRVEATRIFA